jgi:hypothetical protein
MDSNEHLEILKTINKVEPPPYLFTRISARVNTERELFAQTPKLALAFIGLSFLLLINIGFAFHKKKKNVELSEPLLIEMFNTNNHFYE